MTGVHLERLSSLCTHVLRTYAIPVLGSNVTKGLFSIFTGTRVAAEKNVDLPTFVLPSKPI